MKIPTTQLILITITFLHAVLSPMDSYGFQDLIVYSDSTILNGDIENNNGSGPLIINVNGKSRRIDRRLIQLSIKKANNYGASFLLRPRGGVNGFIHYVDNGTVSILVPNHTGDSIRLVHLKAIQIEEVIFYKNPGKGARVGALVGLPIGIAVGFAMGSTPGNWFESSRTAEQNAALLGALGCLSGALIGSALGNIQRKLEISGNPGTFQHYKKAFIRHSILKQHPVPFVVSP